MSEAIDCVVVGAGVVGLALAHALALQGREVMVLEAAATIGTRASSHQAGMRPKINAPGEPAADFVVQGPALHGVPGLVNLFGFKSPGLTSSLAIGAHGTGL